MLENALSSSYLWRNWLIKAKHGRLYHLEIEKYWINLGDPVPIFKATGGQGMLKNDLLAPYHLKKWMDCDQTWKDIAFNNHLERVFKWSVFGDFEPVLKATGGLRLLIFCSGVGMTISCVHDISWSSDWNFTKLAWIYHWDKLKSWLDFGDLDLIFKVFEGLKYVKNSLKLVYLLNLSF